MYSVKVHWRSTRVCTSCSGIISISLCALTFCTFDWNMLRSKRKSNIYFKFQLHLCNDCFVSSFLINTTIFIEKSHFDNKKINKCNKNSIFLADFHVLNYLSRKFISCKNVFTGNHILYQYTVIDYHW